MKICVLESPLGGKYYDANLVYAKAAMRALLLDGWAVYASHLLYPQCLDDFNQMQRTLGMRAGRDITLALMARGAEHIFYGDLGLSPGMREAQAYSERHTIKYLGGEWQYVRGMMEANAEPSSVLQRAFGLCRWIA